MQLSDTEQQTLLQTIKHRAQNFSRAEHLKKLVNADKAYYLADRQRKDAEGTDAKQVKSRYEESAIGIVNPAVEAEVAFMNGLFLSDPKLFSVVSSAEYKELAAAVQLANQQHSNHMKWKRHFLKFFRDCAKYNFGALNIEWVSKETYVSTLSQDLKNREAKNQIWQGNAITRWDPYNMLFDTSVDPSDLSEKGEWAALIELKTQIELYKMIQEFKNDPEDDSVMNITEEMWRSSQDSVDSNMQFEEVPLDEVIPDFLKDGEINKHKGWLAFAGVGVEDSTKKDTPRSDALYNVATVYLRVVPFLYGMTSKDVIEQDKIQIWKIVVVNGSHVIRAKRMTNNHDLLPTAIAQPTEDSLSYNTPGNTRLATAMQRLVKQLSDRRLASLDRNIKGKGFFDSRAIDGEHLKSEAADDKVPVNTLGGEVAPKDAYFEVPFNDSSVYLMRDEILFLLGQADELLGINKASRGQFVKGNKTLEEYQDVMSNADSKQYARAGAIESQCFSVIKHQIKWNIMQYSQETTYLDDETGETKTLDPAEFSKAVFDFKLADGLNPASKFLNPQEMIGLFQVIQLAAQQQQVPMNFWEMLTHLLKQGKNIDLSAYMPKAQAQNNSGGV